MLFFAIISLQTFGKEGYNRCLLASKIIKLFINLMCESFVPASCTVFQVRRIAARSSHEQEM